MYKKSKECECIGGDTEMRSGLLFTTTEGHFLTRFFVGRRRRKKEGKEEKKLVGKRSNPSPTEQTKQRV